MFIFLLRCALHFFLSRRLFHRRHHYIRTSGGGWQDSLKKASLKKYKSLDPLDSRFVACETTWKDIFRGMIRVPVDAAGGTGGI
jgi:hypothetical protein